MLDKSFIKEQILKATDPEKTVANFLTCIAKVNSRERYNKWVNSNFFVMKRETTDDIIFENLARHFGLATT